MSRLDNLEGRVNANMFAIFMLFFAQIVIFIILERNDIS